MTPARSLRLPSLALLLTLALALPACGRPEKPAAPTGKDALDFYREQLQKHDQRRAGKVGR